MEPQAMLGIEGIPAKAESSVEVFHCINNLF